MHPSSPLVEAWILSYKTSSRLVLHDSQTVFACHKRGILHMSADAIIGYYMRGCCRSVLHIWEGAVWCRLAYVRWPCCVRGHCSIPYGGHITTTVMCFNLHMSEDVMYCVTTFIAIVKHVAVVDEASCRWIYQRMRDAHLVNRVTSACLQVHGRWLLTLHFRTYTYALTCTTRWTFFGDCHDSLWRRLWVVRALSLCTKETFVQLNIWSPLKFDYRDD